MIGQLVNVLSCDDGVAEHATAHVQPAREHIISQVITFIWLFHRPILYFSIFSLHNYRLIDFSLKLLDTVQLCPRTTLCVFRRVLCSPSVPSDNYTEIIISNR